MKKRGISPLIATVLLIGFIIALVAVVMLWGKGFIQEKAEKEGELAQAQLSCTRIIMDANILGGKINIVNKGGTKISGLIIRAGSNVKQCKPVDARVCGSAENPFTGLNQLESFEITNIVQGMEGDVTVIPAILPKGIGAPLIPCSDKMKTIIIP